MGLRFLNPAVWWAALAIAVPIVLHMLTRATRRPVTFPSTRFLETTRLAAVSRSTIQDWPLLFVRVALVIGAVAALAGPILVTPAREAAWRTRVARAVVLDDRTAAPEDELRSAAVSAVFARARVRDAVADAVRWLEEQSPAAREVVVLSAFRRGTLDPEDLASVPAGVGVRLVRTGEATSTREREIARLTWRDGRAVRVTERLVLTPTATEVQEIDAQPLREPPVRVRASAADQATADAALRAVLRRGLRLPPAGLMGPIDVEWPGSAEALAVALQTRLAAPLDAWEPETLSEADLASLSRSIAAVETPTPVDAGDRRLAWAIVLALLVVESFMRLGGRWT